MMTKTFQAAAFLAAGFFSSYANAQTPAVTLTPENRARWDAAGQIGWLGVNKSELAPDWNDWYDAASFTGSAGYYWTPHLKAELDISTTTQGDIYTYEPLLVPGDSYPYPRPVQDFFRATAVSAGLAYQFFENQWFHPFIGTGVEAVAESSRRNLAQQLIPGRGGIPPILQPAQTTEWQTAVTARPFVLGGFKWYVSERAFVRTDLRSSFSSDGWKSVVWRAGVGFDF